MIMKFKYKLHDSFYIILILIFILPVSHSISRNSRNSQNSPQNQSPPGTSLIKTTRNDDGLDSSLYPWRFHHDFNEKHPGEDQIAVETRFPEDEMAFGDSAGHNYNPGVYAPPPMSFEQHFESDEMFIPSIGMDHHNHHFSPNWWPRPMFFNPRPWWKGPNVCIKREEEDMNKTSENPQEKSDTDTTTITSSSSTTQMKIQHPNLKMQFSLCNELDTRYTCEVHMVGPKMKKKVKTDFECCEGYKLDTRINQCERGRFKNTVESIDDMGGKEFIRLVKMAGLVDKLMNENLTIFVSDDEAMANYLNLKNGESNAIVISARRRRDILLGNKTETNSTEPTAEEQNDDENENDWRKNVLDQQEKWRSELERIDSEKNSELSQMLLSHMIQGKISTDDFVDEQVVYSENEDSTIRFNTFNTGDGKVRMVNCARLISINHFCTNGIVHMTDRVFKPVTKSMDQVLAEDPELSTFYSLLKSSGEWEKRLSEKTEHLTLFAPKNSAFEKLDKLLEKMRNGDPCLEKILKNHILPHTLCSSVVFKQAQVRNLNEIQMDLIRYSDDRLFIKNSEFIVRDIVTKNGVIHIIDSVLISENDKPLSSVLANVGLTSFLETLTSLGLNDSFDSMNNVTIFAPSNTAMSSISDEIRNDPQKLRNIIMYHVSNGQRRACDMSNGQIMTTKATGNLPIKMNLYYSFPITDSVELTAQCSRVIHANYEFCGGVVHVVDRLLIPPELDIIETLKTQKRFTIITRLLQESNLDVEKGPFTLFVPSDEAFYALPRKELEKILNDTSTSEKFLKLHIIQGSVCCSGIAPQLWFLTKMSLTMSGDHVPIYRDSQGRVNYGNVQVTTCDLTASNGIIHTINSILKPERRRFRRSTQIERDCIQKELQIEN